MFSPWIAGELECRADSPRPFAARHAGRAGFGWTRKVPLPLSPALSSPGSGHGPAASGRGVRDQRSRAPRHGPGPDPVGRTALREWWRCPWWPSMSTASGCFCTGRSGPKDDEDALPEGVSHPPHLRSPPRAGPEPLARRPEFRLKIPDAAANQQESRRKRSTRRIGGSKFRRKVSRNDHSRAGTNSFPARSKARQRRSMSRWLATCHQQQPSRFRAMQTGSANTGRATGKAGRSRRHTTCSKSPSGPLPDGQPPMRSRIAWSRKSWKAGTA